MSEPVYSFQRSGDGSEECWIVHIKRRGAEEQTLGTVTINQRLVDTVFDVWSQRSERLTAEAKLLLQSNEMWEGLVEARAKYHDEEQTRGGTIVKIDGDEMVTRWHTFRRADDYAQERLKQAWKRGLYRQRRAEMFCDLPHGTTLEFKDAPWTKPFHAIEINKYGHLKVAKCSADDFNREGPL